MHHNNISLIIVHVCRDDELVARGRALELDQVIVGAVGGEGSRQLHNNILLSRWTWAPRPSPARSRRRRRFRRGGGGACRGFLNFSENRVVGILNAGVS